MSAQHLKWLKKNEMMGEFVWFQGFNENIELLALMPIFTLMPNVFVWQMKIVLVVTHFSLWI